MELSQLQQAAVAREPLRTEEVRQAVVQFGTLLEDVTRLVAEAAYQAAHVVRQLVGGRVWVGVEARSGRKRGVVRGRFTPRLVTTVVTACGASEVNPVAAESEVEVWLRRPPRLEAAAEEIRRLYEEEGLGFRTIAKRLGMGCGNVYQSYLRYYEMRGLPVPPRRPRGRHPKG